MFANDPAPKDFLPDARDAALKALQLDASLAEAHTALANIRVVLERNWTAAESEFKQAIQLNPSYAPAHTWYAHYLVATGRADEGVAEAKRALELDPFSAFTRDFAEWACFLARRYDLSIQQSRKSIELSPEFPWALYDLGQVYEGMGRTDEAIQAYLKAEEGFGMNQDRLRELRNVYQQFGEKAYWRKTLELCVQEFRQPRKFASVSGFGFCDYMQNVDVSEIHLRLGDNDAAFRYLEIADTNRDAQILYLNVDPHWDSLRSDPRFRDFVRRIGLAH